MLDNRKYSEKLEKIMTKRLNNEVVDIKEEEIAKSNKENLV